jgi:hypothetical protein
MTRDAIRRAGRRRPERTLIEPTTPTTRLSAGVLVAADQTAPQRRARPRAQFSAENAKLSPRQ